MLAASATSLLLVSSLRRSPHDAISPEASSRRVCILSLPESARIGPFLFCCEAPYEEVEFQGLQALQDSCSGHVRRTGMI